MFFIPVALLLCVTSAIAGPIPPGDYIITNVQYHGAVCAFDSFNPIFVCREPRPPFDIWRIRDAPDYGHIFENVALHTFAAIRAPRDGEPVITDRFPAVFSIESVGDDEFIIKLLFEDLLWNAEPPLLPPRPGEVKLRPAQEWESERWRFTPHRPLQYNHHDRWNLMQPIWRLFGYI